MKLVKHEFPNPVLGAGRSDYIEGCKFSTTINEQLISVDDKSINLHLSYNLKCNGIKNLIDQGKAKVIIVVESSASYYRRAFTFSRDETSITIRIPKFDVVNSVVITGNIVAAEPIPAFSCNEFNSLYFGTSTFEIRKGDILATEYSHNVNIDDSELEKPISSIFPIYVDHEVDKAIVPIFTSGQIEIHLNEECFEMYKKLTSILNGALSRYAAAVIVYPVLVEAIERMHNAVLEENDEVNSRWFRSIDKRAQDLNPIPNWLHDDYSATDVANQLLGNIGFDSMKRIINLFDKEFSGQDDISVGGVD